MEKDRNTHTAFYVATNFNSSIYSRFTAVPVEISIPAQEWNYYARMKNTVD